MVALNGIVLNKEIMCVLSNTVIIIFYKPLIRTIFIISIILKIGKYPHLFRATIQTTPYKSGDKQIMSNYRLIAMTYVIDVEGTQLVADDA